ncbi:hypothetical protein FB451DRAFT_1564240 [Mycena latifolia]|nr:hypothetical protein FB451DRAFT_1564240 [Mycena latifolia]
MPSSSQSPPPAPRRRASASPSRDAGVKGITRKVIRTLEGLGHPALSEADDEADDEHEVARALAADAERRAGKQRAIHPSAGAPQKKIDWEIPRKVFHSSIGFITLGLYLTPSMSPRTVALTLWAALAVIGPSEFVRLRAPAVERVYERALGFLMRESERHGTNGTLWYILGVNFALTFYPIDVATVAILMCVLPPCLPSCLPPLLAVLLPSHLAFLPPFLSPPPFLLFPFLVRDTHAPPGAFRAYAATPMLRRPPAPVGSADSASPCLRASVAAVVYATMPRPVHASMRGRTAGLPPPIGAGRVPLFTPPFLSSILSSCSAQRSRRRDA